MSFQLQQFDQENSAYERPEQPWVCGRTLNGEACRIGPDLRGNCRATTECVPVRSGDRWNCTRPPMAGGKCEHGPLPDGACSCRITPCQPLRSQRSRRNLAVSGTVSLIIGILLLFGAGRYGQQFFSPGPLSMNHAELDTKCADCHSAGNANAAGIVGLAVRPPEGHDESRNCLACHNLETHALSPHSLPQGTLAVLSDEARSQPARSPTLRTALVQHLTDSTGKADDVACATCHREHQGRTFNLARMDSVRCQSCHHNAFDSFPDGHPEFSSDFPTRRRTRIAFNHRTHIEHHFPGEGYTADCSTCHEVDPSGERMLVKNFDVTCGSCHHHRDQLRGAGLPRTAVRVFTLPAVDLDTLRARGIWTGDAPWPANASIGDEIEITPFMRLLLAGDAAMVRDLEHFADPKRLFDLSGATDEVVAAAGRVIWGVKRLILGLTEGGPDALSERLHTALGPIRQTELDALAGQPADVPIAPHMTWHANLTTLRERYLPGLADDVRRYEADPSLLHQPPPAPEPAPAPQPEPAAEGDDDAADEDLLGGDEDLLGGDEDLLGSDEDLLGGDEDLLGGDEDLLGGDDDLLGGDEDLPGGGEDLLGGDEDLPGGDDDLLGGGDDLLGGGDDLLGGGEDLLGGDEDLPGGDDGDAVEVAREDPQQVLDELRESLREAAGWVFQGDQFTVAYRPGGHANQFMYHWLERASRAGDGPAATACRGIFDTLRAEKAPGWCIRCHSIDEDLPSPRINWTAERPRFGSRQFTRFEHAPHFNFKPFRDCVACHSVDAIDDDTVNAWKSSYANGSMDPDIFAASFGPITKAHCVECHTPDGAGDGCLSCHNYHVGEFPAILRPPTFGATEQDE